MTQENKELLLKYLCAALPYGVKCHFKYGSAEDDITLSCIDNNVARFEYGWYGTFHVSIDADYIKPYLRPMSNMTKEEREEMYNLLSPEGTAIYGNDGIALPLNHCGEFVPYEFMNRIIQYLLKNHFDFMGLIPKGLAIEVTKENNLYESKDS